MNLSVNLLMQEKLRAMGFAFVKADCKYVGEIDLEVSNHMERKKFRLKGLTKG